MKKRTKRPRKREEVLEILEAFHRSGLTQAAFADKRGVAVSTLQFWLRKVLAMTRNRGSAMICALFDLAPPSVLDRGSPVDETRRDDRKAAAAICLVTVPISFNPS